MDISLNLDLIDFHKPKNMAALKDNSEAWLAFRKMRFSNTSDGEYAVMRNLDLSYYSLEDFPADHIAFIQCNLDGATFRNTTFTFGTAFINCSIKNADFTNTLSADALFVNCDLTGIKISPLKPYTRWTSNDLDGKVIMSIFDGCKIDDQTQQFLIKNKCLVDGVELTQEQRLNTASEINDKLYRIIAAPILDL